MSTITETINALTSARREATGLLNEVESIIQGMAAGHIEADDGCERLQSRIALLRQIAGDS